MKKHTETLQFLAQKSKKKVLKKCGNFSKNPSEFCQKNWFTCSAKLCDVARGWSRVGPVCPGLGTPDAVREFICTFFENFGLCKFWVFCQLGGRADAGGEYGWWLGGCPHLDCKAPQQFKRVDCAAGVHVAAKNARKLHKNCPPIIWCCPRPEIQRTVRDGKVGDGKRTVGNYCIRKNNCVIFFQKNWGNFWGR